MISVDADTETMLLNHPALSELRRIVQKIGTFSQVGAAEMGRTAKGSDDDIGGRRPAGGINRRDDREPGFRQKSAEHFQRKLNRVRSEAQLEALLREAKDALDAWQRTPIPKGQEPERSSPQWKRYVAESPLDGGELARKFGVTRQYIYTVRKAYREAA